MTIPGQCSQFSMRLYFEDPVSSKLFFPSFFPVQPSLYTTDQIFQKAKFLIRNDVRCRLEPGPRPGSRTRDINVVKHCTKSRAFARV